MLPANDCPSGPSGDPHATRVPYAPLERPSPQTFFCSGPGRHSDCKNCQKICHTPTLYLHCTNELFIAFGCDKLLRRHNRRRRVQAKALTVGVEERRQRLKWTNEYSYFCGHATELKQRGVLSSRMWPLQASGSDIAVLARHMAGRAFIPNPAHAERILTSRRHFNLSCYLLEVYIMAWSLAGEEFLRAFFILPSPPLSTLLL
ncbi:hypothetical protein CPB86DRAFT_501154 [Serendipita vermifera]|nr:hypothetical protein CPB86DRAFT_501154 [Serendipita vermifera]